MNSTWNYKAIFKFLLYVFVVIIAIVYIYGVIFDKGERWEKVSAGVAPISRTAKGFILTESLLYKASGYGSLTDSVAEATIVKNGELIGTFVCSQDKTVQSSQNKSSLQDGEDFKIDEKAIQQSLDTDFKKLNCALKTGDNSTAVKLKRNLIYNLEFLGKIKNLAANAGSFDAKFAVKMIGSPEQVENASLPLISTETGIVSYYVDMYDGVLNFDDRYTFDYEKLFSNVVVPINTINERFVPNDIVLKLVDKKKWYILVNLNVEDLDNFLIDSRLEVSVGDNKLIGIVVDKYKSKNMGILALEVDSFSNIDLSRRIVDVHLVLDKVSGIKIPRKAIHYNDKDVKGVYVMNVDNQKTFRPIEIIKEDDSDDTVVVTSDVFTKTNDDGNIETVNTVSSGDRILVKGK